jgi:hypothetical protein
MPVICSRTTALALALAVLMVLPATARVDVTVEFDKSFDFKPVRTWAWTTPEPGLVKMARTKDDDPEAMRARAEPVILDAVGKEIGQRGLTPATGAPDVTVTYYLLLSTTMSAQTMGQFLPAVTDWGLPPFAPATQSLKVMNQGSLVLDLSAAGRVVWRGLARANIKFDVTDAQREALVREAVRDLLRRYPPRN